LSGSLQGAGGVGGLLEVSDYGSSTTTNCFAAFDGNGNLAALVNAANGTTLANYEYGPFGEVIRQTGPMAKVNPIRFSTKYQDDESDLLYYGYRYYKASTGTWLSRDPYASDPAFSIQHDETASIDDVRTSDEMIGLYSFCDNNSSSQWDYLGLLTVGGGVPSRGILEHNSYLEFTVTCPACTQFVFDSVDYSGAVPALQALFGTTAVTSIAGPIPPASGLGGFRGYGSGSPNCSGTAVNPQVYMRTRFTSLTDAPLKGGKGAAAYAAGTTMTYHCAKCAPPSYTPGPGNPVLGGQH
jgi:RHS repeat-associated protein